MDHPTNSPPARDPNVVDARLADDQAVLLHLESGAYHELNPVGAEIWDLIDGERTVGEISAALRSRLRDPPDELDEIVARYLSQLRERYLIR